MMYKISVSAVEMAILLVGLDVFILSGKTHKELYEWSGDSQKLLVQAKELREKLFACEKGRSMGRDDV